MLMSLFEKSQIWEFTKIHLYSCAALLLAPLPGFAPLVQAAIFDELKDGTLVQRDGGASENAPPTGISTGSYVDPALATQSALPFLPTNMPVAGQNAAEAIRQQLALPSPRRMSLRLSGEQLRMRELAARVGLSFANASAVKNARLDEGEFVNLFTTMIHRESGFNRLAVSSAGASGLGQLMPATAADLGVCDVFSAEDNLQGAAIYLTDMLDRFGTPALALAAYNAGPTAVMKYRGIPPYDETRQYVADILHAMRAAPKEEQALSNFEISSRRASPARAGGSILLDAPGRNLSGCRTGGLANRSGPSVYP